MQILVRLSPEIMIKSPTMRRHLIDLLRKNIRHSLQKISKEAVLTGGWDHLIISLPDNHELTVKVVEKLKTISGINSFFSMEQEELKDFATILQKTLRLYTRALTGKRFCIRVRRSGTHDFRSIDLEKYLGEGVLKKVPGTKVDLTTPEITINLEVRGDMVIYPGRKHAGLSGMPVGSEKRVFVLISGGYDSPVAAQMMMNRGCRVDYLFFNFGGVSQEAAVSEVVFHLWQKFSENSPSKFLSVPFGKIIDELLQNTDRRLRPLLLKRMMYRVADRIARKYRTPAFVTGESIGQVSSQTLTNLSIISEVSKTQVFRPLLAMNKSEIIRKAHEIGTAAFAEAIPEYCGIVSNKPTAEAKKGQVLKAEESFDFTLLDVAFTNIRVGQAEDFLTKPAAPPSIEFVSHPKKRQSVIDIRDQEDAEADPLTIKTKVLRIPFYRLREEFGKLDRKKTWLLYCEQGVLSKAHAEELLRDGYQNVKVYRPES